MINRRQFMQQTGTLALGGLMANPLAEAIDFKRSRKVGLQLFTLFTVIDKDVQGNLKKVADIGYKEIESAFSFKGGYYGMTSTEFKKMVSDLGMTWRSHHIGGAPFKPRPGSDRSKMPKLLNLRDNAQEVIDQVKAGGVNYLVCANTPIETLDEVKASAEVLQKAGELCKKADLTLCFHNHDAEFKAVEGQLPYDIFLSQVSADVLKFELDLAWVSKAGVDPIALFEKHPKRFPLWHVKDMDKEFKTIMPVGEGTIDFKRIFAHAKTAGMKHFFVEHDMPADAFASIKSSIDNLKKML